MRRHSVRIPEVALRHLDALSVIWTLTFEDKCASCEIAFVPNGVEGSVLRNGRRLYSRVFPTGEETLEWAGGERKDLIAKGWVALSHFGSE